MPSARTPLPRWLPLAVFAVVAAGLVVAGLQLRASATSAARERAGAALEAVAALKIDAVRAWRADHLRNAEFAAAYPVVRDVVLHLTALSPERRAHGALVLGQVGRRFGYAEIAVLDAGGRAVVVGAGSAPAPPAPGLVERALAWGGPAVSVLVADPAPRLEVAAAVLDAGPAAAVLYVRVSAAEFLQDLVASWPVPSATAEALFIVPEPGGGARFLAEPQHPGALGAGAIVTDPDRAVTLAARGVDGVVSTPGPGGAPVLAAIRPVPDSQWKVVTHMNMEEIDAPLLHPLEAISALVVALLAVSGAALAAWWWREAERRRLEAQLAGSERLAALGALAAGVAHEVNNPLAYVLSNLDAAGAEATAAGRSALAEAIAEARGGVDRVRQVVRALGTFSRPASGERVPVDVGAELEAAVRMARNEIRHRARLATDVGPLPRVLAGERELGQVFLNLLLNAAHAIPEGNAAGNEISVRAAVDDRGRVVVEVRDTGAGIPAAALPRLFEPFYTTKPNGLGLGLPICRGIVSALGGEIAVESEVGSGSTFRVTLPPAPTPLAAPAPAAPEREHDAPRGRVLVVDDDALVARAVARMLRADHEVVVTTSAREALDRIALGEPFDAIVCDLMMPDVSGMDLHAHVAALDPGLAARMVFATGGAFTDRAREFLDRVPNPRVEKPFDPRALRAAVGGAVRSGYPARRNAR